MNLKLTITLVFTILVTHLYAQKPSDNGAFSVDERRGCRDFTVNIDMVTVSCDTTPCVMDFGDGSLIDYAITHTYTQAGIYDLSVYWGGGNSDNIQIEVFEDTIPAFDVYACNNGSKISVNITDNNYDQYVINYNDASPTDVVLNEGPRQRQHTYGNGTQTITVHGQHTEALANCSPSSQSITIPLDTAAPSIDRIIVLENNQIQLEMTTQPHVQYNLEVAVNNSSSFRLLQTLHNHAGPLSITGLIPETNYYCFRLRSFNPCANTYFNSGTSNTVCSSTLTAVARDGQNDLAWKTSATGVLYHNILRDGAVVIFGNNLPAASSSFVDNFSICNNTHAYQLETIYNNGSTSYSAIKSVTSFSTETPTPIQNVSAVVGPGGVNLTWRQDPDFEPAEYRVMRSSTFYNTAAASPFTDAGYSTEAAYCYEINYKDVCNNESPPGINVCPVRLTGDLGDNNTIHLSWTEYSGWQNGVSAYVVEKYSGSGFQAFNTGTSTTLTDNADDLQNQVYTYTVRAIATDPGLASAVSNAVTIIKEPNIYYPAAFTPNGDGLNDLFRVFGQYIVSFEMRIFNRWGELMYTTHDMEEGWDGSFNGKAMPEGTYIFVANISDLAGRTHKRSGSVHLLKK